MPQPTAFDQLIAEVEACVDRLLTVPPACKEFRVIRHLEVNGKPYARVLGVGVVLSSGRTIMEWIDCPDLIERWPSAEDVLAQHADGRTEVIWRDR